MGWDNSSFRGAWSVDAERRGTYTVRMRKELLIRRLLLLGEQDQGRNRTHGQADHVRADRLTARGAAPVQMRRRLPELRVRPLPATRSGPPD